MRHEESRLQQSCVKWFRLQYPQYARLLFSVPNGAVMSPVTARIMKAEGIVAGVSDLILLVPSGNYHALCIEMKTETGRQSKEQKEWQEAVEAQGYRYSLCRSFDEFYELMENYKKSGKLEE